jgi:predicted GH43/DUF377 family glycosyl hydrolase
MNRRTPLVIVGVAALVACSSNAHSSPKDGKVSLHGWVTWSGEMPTLTTDPNPTSTNPLEHIQMNQQAYASAAAQGICGSSFAFSEVKSMQVIVHGSNGDVLGAASTDAETLQNGQTPAQQSTDPATGGGFTCAVGWHAPPVAGQNAYTIVFNGHSTVVNQGSASEPIYLGL